jgi:hypothetical protein
VAEAPEATSSAEKSSEKAPAEKTPAELELEDAMRSIRGVGEDADTEPED